MQFPMRRFGMNLMELFLSDLVTFVGWLLIAFAVLAAIFSGAFGTTGFVGGVLFAGTMLVGLIMLLASAGLRQNRAALDLGYGLLALLGLAWVARGLVPFTPTALAAGLVMLAFLGGMAYVRGQAVKARFNPRFFSQRQFETMVQVVDTMIDGDGEEVLHPIEVAIRVDHVLASVDSPHRQEIRKVLVLVEWVLPLLIFRPFPFTALGSNQRRRVVEKVMGASGMFRDAARTLKMLSCAGYYGSPEGMKQVGYVPVDARASAHGADQTPSDRPDPFPR